MHRRKNLCPPFAIVNPTSVTRVAGAQRKTFNGMLDCNSDLFDF